MCLRWHLSYGDYVGCRQIKVNTNRRNLSLLDFVLISAYVFYFDGGNRDLLCSIFIFGDEADKTEIHAVLDRILTEI